MKGLYKIDLLLKHMFYIPEGNGESVVITLAGRETDVAQTAKPFLTGPPSRVLINAVKIWLFLHMLYCIVDVLNTTASATILPAMTKSVNDNHAKKFILLKKKKQQRGRTRAKSDPRFVEKKYCSLGGMVGFDTHSP